MKKFMSIMLAVTMIVSLFAINASALIAESYTVMEGAAAEAVAVDQKFDGTNTADFVEGDYGYANITEDGAINLTAKEADKEDGTVDKLYAKGLMHIGTAADVARGQYVIEFDVTKNDELVGYQSADPENDKNGYNYGVYVTAKRPEYEGTVLEKYGVFIPLCVNTQGKTYKYKVVFDEQKVIDALTADGKAEIKGNTDNLAYGQKLMTVYKTEPGKDAVILSSVSSYGLNSTLNGRVRFLFGTSAEGAFDTFNLYFSTNASSGEFNFDESDYTIDNIKIYAPEIIGTEKTYNYDFVTGDVNLTLETEKTITMGTNANATTRAFFEGDNGDKDYTNDACVHSDRYAMTFDARCDVVGQALTINMASDVQATGGTHIVATEDILDKWYTYKVYLEHNNKNDAEKWAMNAMKIYRREAGSDVWTELTRSVDYFSNMEGRMASTPRNFAQLAILPNGTSTSSVNCAGEHTEGIWTVKNLQVIPDTAICGNAEIVDGNIVADVNIGTNGARTAYAATYKGGRLVNAKLVSIPEYAESFNFAIPYDAATADSATLYIWDNSANPKLNVVDLLDAVE